MVKVKNKGFIKNEQDKGRVMLPFFVFNKQNDFNYL